jgi:hypothetical protein
MASCNDRPAEFWRETGCCFSASPRVRSLMQPERADVVSKRFVAEVKHHAVPMSPAIVRQIFGVATAQGKWEQVRMALFVYDFAQGTLVAKPRRPNRPSSGGCQACRHQCGQVRPPPPGGALRRAPRRCSAVFKRDPYNDGWKPPSFELSGKVGPPAPVGTTRSRVWASCRAVAAATSLWQRIAGADGDSALNGRVIVQPQAGSVTIG